MSTQDEEPNTYELQCFDPFPQPQTYPTGWDLSELISAPKDEPVLNADDVGENESL